jgi:amino-acid N-acetyltransferase
MLFGGVAEDNLQQVRDLLAACALPSSDLDAGALHYFIGAWAGERLVGVVGLQPLDHGALLRSLAVAPEHRGDGIGSRLCDEAESLARAGGMSELYLLTTQAADYFAARGFGACARSEVPAAVQETAQFRELCPTSAVVMHKHLAPLRG